MGATSSPSGQQVPEEAEGGARARTAHNSLTPPPVGQVTLQNPGGGSLESHPPSQPSHAHACLSLISPEGHAVLAPKGQWAGFARGCAFMTHLPLIRFLILQMDDGKEEGSGAESGHTWPSLESEK